jgi:hypothetical protein
MTAAVKTAPKPQAPKGKAASKSAAKPAAKPADQPTPEAAPKPADRTGNSAYAPEAERKQVADLHAQLRKDGWTRPAISALTDFSDSQVWRAQNLKVHTSEMDRWLAFFSRVAAGEVKPPTSGRKPKIEELQARVTEAIQLLGNEAKTAAQYRKIVDAALEVLADVVPTVPEATPSA